MTIRGKSQIKKINWPSSNFKYQFQKLSKVHVCCGIAAQRNVRRESTLLVCAVHAFQVQ
jgi:hypothetical protein